MASLEARLYKPPPPPPPPKPTPYARLVDRVWSALQAASQKVTGSQWAVSGGGDPELPLTGYCPVCCRGIVAVRLIHADPPEIDLDGCSAGCSAQQIVRTFR